MLEEVGAYTLHGDEIRNLMVDSPDGYIRVDHKPNLPNCCHPDVWGFNNLDMTLEIKCPFPDPKNMPVHYSIPKYYIIQILTHMKVTNLERNLYVSCGPKSVTVIEARFAPGLWNDIWERIKVFFDKRRPAAKNWHKEISSEFAPRFDHYIEHFTSFICEVPIVKTEEGVLIERSDFSPYHKSISPIPVTRTTSLEDMKELIHTLYDDAAIVMKDAHHILREEAAEILVFLAVDSSRISIKGIPCHLPVAYGLKGHTLTMSVMRKMIEDVRNQCQDYNIGVRCECYDGQFLNLIKFDENGQPLTRLTFLQKMYQDLTKWSKEKCINFILNEAIPNGIPISLIVTPDKVQIWNRHCQQVMNRRSRHVARAQDKLDSDDISKLMSGSKLGRRISQRVSADTSNSFSSDEDSDDDDYIYRDSDVESDHSSDYDSSDNISDEEDLDEELQALLDDESDRPEPSEPSFLEDVMTNFKYIGKGPIDWEDKSIDYLVSEFLQKPVNCMKLLHEHLNAIGNLIQTYTGVKVFNSSDNKATKISKLTSNLGTSTSQNLISRTKCIYRVKSLIQVCVNSLLKAMYPKVYLQIVVAKCISVSKMDQWERGSPIPINYIIDQGTDPSFSHSSYSFPNRSSVRDSIEHRCIDPSHTLANMHSQISRHGYDFCSREAFIRVSETHHDVLPKSIIIDQLDRQSIRISKRFFSEEVEAVLIQNGDKEEAKFVHLVRDWYEACDERGIHIYKRLRHMENFFDFLRAKVDWIDFPPPSKFIQGMPVQTYESIMQGISTRMQIFSLSQTPVNQRSISTLSVESFFSDLTNMEFSGLGCPKAVDIPRLISHVAELNHIRHDLHRGFVFNTTNRAAYPYHTLDAPSEPNLTMFDLPRRRRKRKAQTLLALPKAITRGQPTIREHYRKDESKVLLHRRAGVPDTFDPFAH